MLFCFCRQEHRLLQCGQHPLLNITVFHHHHFTLAATGLLLFQFVCLGLGFLLPGCIVGAMFAPISGRIYDRLGARKPLLTGSLLDLAQATSLFCCFGAWPCCRASACSSRCVIIRWNRRLKPEA